MLRQIARTGCQWAGPFLVLASAMLAVPLLATGADWPQWRGPAGTGHSAETSLPEAWDVKSIAWRSELPGSGQSSPCVVGERIFLTSALESGKQRVVFCVDRNDGKLLWQKIAWTGEPEPSHKMNGWASPTCATDGERVYAFFGRGGGLFCYTIDGDLVWQRELGVFQGPWGTAACPFLLGDLVIQNCDAEADASLTAFDKRTGEIVWRTPRDNFRGWSTPLLIQAGDRQELVLNGHSGVRAYNPLTGVEYWFCKSFSGRGEPTITPAGALLVAVNGTPGDMYAIRPGGQGTVTDTHMAWHIPRKGGRDLPSPIVQGQFLIMSSMQGICTGHDISTGKPLWQERLGGNYAASPVAYQGKVFFLNEAGETVVIEPGPELKITARNNLDAPESEVFRASLSPSDGQLFIRSDRTLYCIGSRTSKLGK